MLPKCISVEKKKFEFQKGGGMVEYPFPSLYSPLVIREPDTQYIPSVKQWLS